MISFTTASALDCDLTAGACSEATVLNAATQCCSKATPKRIKKCLTSKIRRIRATKRALGATWVRGVRSELASYKSNLCEGVDLEAAAVCTCENTVDQSEFLERTEAACCDKEYRDDRRSCLTSRRASLRRSKNVNGVEVFDAAKIIISSLYEDASCGAGGELNKTGCDSTIDINDGASTGHLWKPYSDHSPHNPVFLLRAGVVGTSCSLITTKGKAVDSLNFASIANGARYHYRPTKHCTDMPNNLLAKCQINGQKTCFRVPDPCNRYD